MPDNEFEQVFHEGETPTPTTSEADALIAKRLEQQAASVNEFAQAFDADEQKGQE